MSTKELLTPKIFPLNYSSEVMNIVNAMAITPDIQIVGSQAMSASLYSADYDLVNVADGKYNSINDAALAYTAKLKEVIMHLMCIPQVYIGDIKAGVVPEWEIPLGTVKGEQLSGFNVKTIIAKIQKLRNAGIMNEAEYDMLRPMVKENPKFSEWLQLKELCKFHVIRWSPKAFLRGATTLRDGKTIHLFEAVQSPGMIKIDAVAFVDNKYSDFSCLYFLLNKGKPINDFKQDARGIKTEIMALGYAGDYFKVVKRMLSVAKEEKKDDIETLFKIINSQLGMLYSIISDAKTIIFLLENEDDINISVIRKEIDGFRERLGSLYSVPGVNTPGTLEKLLTISKLPSDMKGRVKMYKQMTELIDFFQKALNKLTIKTMKKYDLLPLAPIYLP